MTDQHRKRMATIRREFRRLGERPVVVELSAMEWFTAAGGLIMMMKRRGVSARNRAVVTRVAAELIEAIDIWSPDLAAILERDLDAEKDRLRGQ